MNLRFFADHCISNFTMDALRAAGHEALRLKEHISADSPDPVVLGTAQRLNCILLSLNGDFADIVTYPPANYKGIVALQMRNHPEIEPQLIERLNRYLAAHPHMEHYRGRLFLVEVHRIRVRE